MGQEDGKGWHESEKNNPNKQIKQLPLGQYPETNFVCRKSLQNRSQLLSSEKWETQLQGQGKKKTRPYLHVPLSILLHL